MRREPNGQIQRTYVDPKQQVMDQPHRVIVPVKFRDFQEAESEFGRLVLLGHISPAQHEAGNIYAGLAARYFSAIHAASPNPAAMDFGKVGKGAGAGMPDETARTTRERYNRAFEACGPRNRQKAVRDYAVFEKPVPSKYEMDLLHCGLNDLVKHFGIDANLQITHRGK